MHPNVYTFAEEILTVKAHSKPHPSPPMMHYNLGILGIGNVPIICEHHYCKSPGEDILCLEVVRSLSRMTALRILNTTHGVPFLHLLRSLRKSKRYTSYTPGILCDFTLSGTFRHFHKGEIHFFFSNSCDVYT